LQHGGVHIGDALYLINDSVITQLPFDSVKIILSNQSIPIRKLKFICSDEHYRRKRGIIRQPTGLSTAVDTFSTVFQSIIRQYRVCNETQGKKFVEYEIACQLRMSNSKRLDSSHLLKWTVWRRYSRFESLHKAIVGEYGWKTKCLEECYPPAHVLVWDKFSSPFLEQRREELNRYWAKLLEINRISDFHNKQHCSLSLYDFLEVEIAVSSNPPPAPAPSLQGPDNRRAMATPPRVPDLPRFVLW